MRLTLLTLFLFSCLQTAFSQKAFVSGTITDSTRKPLFGATVAVFGEPIGTTTDDGGRFDLEVPAEKTIKLVYSYTGLAADTVIIRLSSGEKKVIDRRLSGKIYQMKDVTIEEQSMKDLNVKSIQPALVGILPTPNQSVEDIIKTLPGVSSSNELSSQYSVRGGNFDENLVYINDIEVYRPLLVRAGQQEGLSIIHPDMVEAIRFSAGGFDAMYGDKLSSVLDIRYKRPTRFAGSAYASLLGGGLEFENCSKDSTTYWMTGIRQKSNQYLLNSLETKGEYRPSFTDVQLLTGHDIGKKWNVELFGNLSLNRYNLIPENRETNFGTINDAKRFTVYFEGREADRYQTWTAAASTTYKPSEKIKLKLILTGYRTREEENFDILGQYFLDQLEADLGKADFGQVAFNLGVGSFLGHARNRLDGEIYSVEHRGEFVSERGILLWGVRAQEEHFIDRMHEWNYNDSAGFSIPSTRDSINPLITLNDVVISNNDLRTSRFSGFLQQSWELGSERRFVITAGVRGLYYSLNERYQVSPRASITYRPDWDRKVNFRAAGGIYCQAPFYRELRDLDGSLRPETPTQKSIHAVIGNDFPFYALGRNFKLTTEVYYKSLEVLIPYKIDNLRIRYLPDYRSVGYSTGIDLRLFGEFVKGTESWASLSVMKTAEDLLGDYYIDNYNRENEKIIPGYTTNDTVAYSVRVEPGYIPRPADQRVSFSLFFQDYLPKSPTFKMSLFLAFGSRLPFGPPGPDRYKDIFRAPPYRRVDIGFSKQLIGEGVTKRPKSKVLKPFESLSIGLEVFNLLQVSNVASYTWITDISNSRKYAVPNYLTSRQLNIRLNARF